MPASQDDRDAAPNVLNTTAAAAAAVVAAAAAAAAGSPPSTESTDSSSPRRPSIQSYDPMPDVRPGSLFDDISTYRARQRQAREDGLGRAASRRHDLADGLEASRQTPVIADLPSLPSPPQQDPEIQEAVDVLLNRSLPVTTLGAVPPPPPGISTVVIPSAFPTGRHRDASESRRAYRSAVIAADRDSTRPQEPSRDPSTDEIRRRIRSARAVFAQWNLESNLRAQGSASRAHSVRNFIPPLHSWTGDVGPISSGTGGNSARNVGTIGEAATGSEPTSRGGEASGGRMDPRERATPSPTAATTSTHDYAGWAPGTSASEHQRPTISTLRAMAGRNGSSRYSTLGPSPRNASGARTGPEMSSLERRYNMERQRQLERLQQDRADREQAASDGRYPRSHGGEGFASTVVDADGNPIDTGTTAELPNPRSIVYTPPPYRPSTMTASNIYNDHRIQDLADAYDMERLEREMATGSSNNAESEALWARYTHMRQDRLERVERHQRSALRTDRLRRAGASTADDPDGNHARNTASRVQRSGHLEQIRRDLHRDLHELHRDRHPAVNPPAGGSDAARDSVKRAIQYLHRIRTASDECETRDDRAQAAREEGFGQQDGMDTFDRKDFVTDTSVVGVISETSWLIPGTVFRGSQHATNVSAISNYLPQYAAAQRERFGRLGAYIGPRAVANPASFAEDGTGGDRGGAATPYDMPGLDFSLFRSAIRRDRHSGASPDANWHSLQRFRTNGNGATPDALAREGDGGRLRVGGSSSAQARTAEGEDTWPVKVTITSVDYQTMTLTGTMEAMNVPNKPSSSTSRSQARNEGSAGVAGGNNGRDNYTITTFLEGEIIDLQRHSLETRGYKADSSVDGTYWRRLEPFRELTDSDIVCKMLSTTWLKNTIGREYVLMRWKEKCFVDPCDADQGLTISGFYYISLHRATGKIEGLYYDPNSSPYQHLCLTPEMRQFPTYKFQ